MITLFGLTIPPVVVYFLIIRPLFNWAVQQPDKSIPARAAAFVGWVALVFVSLLVLGIVLFFWALASAVA